MSRKLQLKRGLKADIPVLAEGEPAFTTDEKKLYVGDGTANHALAMEAELGALAKKDTVAKTDLADDVQASLDKADSALQGFTEIDPTVPEWAKTEKKPGYTYTEISDKPESFPPSAHKHKKSEITDFPSAMTPSAHKASHKAGGTDALAAADIGAAVRQSGTGTLAIAGWTGTEAPYTYVLDVAGMLDSDTPHVDRVTGTDAAAAQLINEAWGLIAGYALKPRASAGKITFYASDKPTVAIPMMWEAVR